MENNRLLRTVAGLLVVALLLLGMPASLASEADAMQAALDAAGEGEQASGEGAPEDTEKQRLLTLAGQAYASDMNPAFEAAHPDVRVQFNATQGSTVDQLLLDMTTNHAAADIYVLYASSGLLDAAIKKGIALDLSQNGSLAAFSKDMVPFVRDKVFRDDQLYAVPFEITSRQLFAYNEAVGQALGIKRPESLTELAQVFAEWDSRENTDGYFLTSKPLWQPLSSFLVYGINAYIAEHSDGDYVSFDTPAFRDYISMLEKLRMPLSHLREEHSGWQEHLHDKALFVEEYPLLKTQEDTGVNIPGLTPFALPLQAEGAPVIPADMVVLIVNAASPNRELALQYVETLTENYPPAKRIMVDTRYREPVEFENYRENRQTYQQQKEQVEASLANPENQNNTAALREELGRIDAILEEIESEHWQITPDDIAGYDAIMPHIRLMPRISYEYYDAIPATKKLFQEFVQGSMPAHAFVEQLSRMQRLINEESK